MYLAEAGATQIELPYMGMTRSPIAVVARPTGESTRSHERPRQKSTGQGPHGKEDNGMASEHTSQGQKGAGRYHALSVKCPITVPK
jgi:hypothetical protein